MRILIGIAAVALIVGSTAQAATPHSFDLVCSSAGLTKDAEFVPVDARLRVDLDKKQWCQDECETVSSIADLQPTRIWFHTQSEEEKAKGLTDETFVDRQDGEYQSVRDVVSREIGTYRVAVKSVCKPAPFSGFPNIKTAF